jgi:hypothetical protein
MSPLAEDCDIIEGDVCEEDQDGVELPDVGDDLLDLGDLLTVTYREPDGTIRDHQFDPNNAPTLWAWAGGLIVPAIVTEDGIQ